MAKGINKLQFVIFVVFFLFFTGNSYSQLQFSTSYEFSGDIKTDIENDTTDYGIKVQIGAANYSNSGYFRKAQELFGSRPLSEKSLALFSPDDWKSTDARRYILKRSKNERIIVINEAHNNSRHRNFTASLLEGLYKNGYRYLGLEALWVDSIVNQRKFVVWEDGFYTREPEFGNLITEAIRLGFTVFGYEADNKNGEEREQEQVRNIMDFMSSHTEGKYVIHCGYAHAYENEISYWGGKAMALRLKEGLGTELFTINQTLCAEGSLPIVYDRSENVPIVLKTKKDGSIFHGLTDPQTDLCIVYPKTDYVQDRPVWQAYRRKHYTIDTDTLTCAPVLVTAYRKGEYDQKGVPADIIEINAPKQEAILFLFPGEYEIIFQNRRYEIIARYPISI